MKTKGCAYCKGYGWVHAEQGITRPLGDAMSEGPDVCPKCKNEAKKEIPYHLNLRERVWMDHFISSVFNG